MTFIVKNCRCGAVASLAKEHNSDNFYIFCAKCSKKGPYSPNPDVATLKWNAEVCKRG